MKEPSFKFIAVLLGLPLLVAVADRAWTQGPVTKYKSGGASAFYEIQDTFAQEMMGSGVIFLGDRRAYVQITEAEAMNTVGISGTYYQLSFEVSVSTGDGYGYAYGSGAIPAESVTFGKPVNHNLSLKVDTSLLPPTFYTYKYGNIDVGFPNINLRWTRTDNDWYRWEGHQITEIGNNLVVHQQGSGVRYFTIPTGSITLPDVGLPVWSTYADGWLGSEKSTNTLMQRGPVK
ncbi:MAG TPA: hypothetical protein VE398_21045 [Acidobacteriota bacterium]|nr:hypothetical protein [Acidobacteriota bacterium]